MQKKKKMFKTALVLGIAIFILASGFLAGSFNFIRQVSADNVGTLQDSIDSLQNKIDKEQKQRDQLTRELSQIQGSVNSTKAQILRTEALISAANQDILKKGKEIAEINARLTMQKEILKGLVQDFYYSQKNPLLYAVLSDRSLSAFMADVDHISTINQKILAIVDDIKQSLGDVEQAKENIASDKDDQQKLLDLKQSQQKSLLADQADTQLQINDTQATINDLRKKLSKVQSDLSQFLGKSFNAKDIDDAASFASKATGVRKDFLMGMLTVESDLGRYTGGCNFKESKMSGTRAAIFKNICDGLNYNYKTKKVSCPPRSYAGTGGAMGVAQFMPDTWIGYQSSITNITGSHPPDPWDLTDGVVAMALKLAKGGATSKKGECNAAKLYLSGSTSSKYQWYCDKVLYWADNYENLIN